MTNYNTDKMADRVERLIEQSYEGYVPEESLMIDNIVENSDTVEVYGTFTLQAENVVIKDVYLPMIYGEDEFTDLEDTVSHALMEHLYANGGRVDVEIDFDFHTDQGQAPFIFDMKEGTLSFSSNFAGSPVIERIGSWIMVLFDGQKEEFRVDEVDEAFKAYVQAVVTPEMIDSGAYIENGVQHFDPETLR